MNTLNDYYADGHYVMAVSPESAAQEVVRLYGHTPETVRPWTAGDQMELDGEEANCA